MNNQIEVFYISFLVIAAFIAINLALGNVLLRGIHEKETRMQVRRAFRTGLVIRIVCAMLFHIILVTVVWNVKPGFYFDDERHYHDEAKKIASDSPFSIDRILTLRKNYGDHFLYRYVTGCVYRVFGENRLLLRAMGAAFGSLMIPIIARIALFCGPGGQRIAVVTAWLTALCPLLILYSIAILRDWIITLSVSLALLFTLELFARPYNIRSLIGIAACTTMFFNLRNLVIPVFLAACSLWYVFHAVGSTARKLSSMTLAAAALVAALWLTGSSLAHRGFALGSLEEWQQEIDRYALNPMAIARSQARMHGKGTFLEIEQNIMEDVENDIQFNPPLMILAGMRAMLEPSPFWLFTVADFNAAVMFLPGLFWYFLSPCFLVGIPTAFRKWHAHGKLIAIVLFVFLFTSISTLGVGLDPIRARLQVLPLIYVLVSQGIILMEPRSLLRRKTFTAAGLFYAGLAVFYFMGTYLPWPVFHPLSLLSIAALAIFVGFMGLRKPSTGGF